MTRTPDPLPEIKIAKASIPEASTAPNPFTENVAELAANWDDKKGTSKDALKFTAPEADLNRLRSRIADAAKAIGKSARIRAGEADKAGNVEITFWLRPPVKTKSKTAE